MAKDEYARVLEYLPYGLQDSKERHPTVIILTDSLGLLAAALKKGASVEAGRKVYIGENKREEIHHIIGRITPDKLGVSAMQNLRDQISENVKANESKYVGMINTLGPINVRLHALELIPGLGKKTTQKILDERKMKPFTSYGDIDLRIQLPLSIEKEIEERILEEMQNKDKYKIFT